MKTIFILPCCVWILSLVGLAAWYAVDQPTGWDYGVITKAAREVGAGMNPYRVEAAEQDAFLQSAAARAGAPRPFIYVYPPVTLLALKVFADLPLVLRNGCYWLLYGLMILLQIRVALLLAEPRERIFLCSVAPLVLFFPGGLLFDSVLGGNIAFILYGLIFGALWIGWKRDRWGWFYAAVLLASCVKMPYLEYLAIPLLCRRGRWLQVSAVAAGGVALFAAQGLLRPALFHDYMDAVNRIFVYNNDFGSGPSGRFGAVAGALGRHYALWGTVFYLALSAALFGFLLSLSRFYKRGVLRDEQWFPVMLLGVALLFPRLIEYDLFPFTIAMALLAFRGVRATRHPRTWTSVLLTAWIGANLWACGWAGDGRLAWKNIACVLLLSVFAGGCVPLLRVIRAGRVVEEKALAGAHIFA